MPAAAGVPMYVRDSTPDDYPALLALNDASVAVLSPLDAARLETMLEDAACCRVADDGAVRAFVIAFREGACYDSENYRWFDARYPRFLYVDRVVVDSAFRGEGLGRRLYEEVFALARRHDVPAVTGEFDLDPPNPASARFHARQGFVEVGRQVLANGKTVSLQAATPDGHAT
jgi:predicted GNAT superfamily acetyltransferase